MSGIVGLSIGRSFAELTAKEGDKRVNRRWYLPTNPLPQTLQKFFTEQPHLMGSKVIIATDLAQELLTKRILSPIALLVTSGFEQWPYISQPLSEKSLIQFPHRTTPLVTSQMIFGIEERTTAAGQVSKTPDPTELDFVVSKLEMTGVKQVAVGFLHSTVNPANETLVADHLRKMGFEVVASHVVEEPNHEVARWNRTILNATITESFHQFEESLKPVIENFHLSVSFLSSDGTTFSGAPEKCFSTAFSSTAALRNLAQARGHSALVQFGLGGFFAIRTDAVSHVWPSEIGPVGVLTPFFTKLPIQPTTVLGLNPIQGPHWSSRELGYEPGPMLFNRGQEMCWLDVLYIQDKLPSMSGVREMMKTDPKRKIHDQLRSFIRGLETNVEDFTPELMGRSYSRMALALSRMGLPRSVLVTGSLAYLMADELQSRLPEIKWEPLDHSVSDAIVEGE